MAHYDAVISASCYMSPENAIRFLNSVTLLKGKILPIITCPRSEDALGLYAFAKEWDHPVIILQSDYNSRYFCQSIAFVYCITHDIQGRYYAVMDDDIEFIDPNILDHLDKAPAFSTLGFSSNQIVYARGGMNCEVYIGEYGIKPSWLDANNMWSKWETNLLAGLPDCASGVQNCAFTEVEYQHRLRRFTGNPTIGSSYRPLIHHSRITAQNLEKLRGDINIVVEGYKFWREKFGMALDGGQFSAGKVTWEDVYQTLLKDHFTQSYQRHIIFGGIWLDWDAIWYRYGAGIKTIYEVLK